MTDSPKGRARAAALAEQLLAATEQQASAAYRSAFINAFTDLSPTTLDAIEEALARLAGRVDRPEQFVRALVLNGNWDEEGDIVRALLFADVIGEDPNDDIALDFSKGAEEYADLLGWASPVSGLRGDDLRTARALVQLAHAAYEDLPEKASPLNDWMEGPRSRFITDDDLVRVVAEHADRIEDILEFVLSRQSADAQLLREYLDQPRPLGDGAL